MTDLKREVARFKDTESHSGKYIADLEARLTRSDESVLSLQRTVENLESVCERRQEEILVLQTRLDNLTRDGDGWRSDLTLRERKVKELEAKMEEWEKKRKSAGEERLRLGNVVGEVAEARKSMEAINGTSTTPTESGTSTPDEANLSLESQLVALRETHTATLTDLSSVTSKYRDALHEISDLAAQIQEAKLSPLTPPLPESPVSRTEHLPLRRRTTGGRAREAPEPQTNGAGRRLFFRQAASSESLHSRYVASVCI
jgi:chromosome segregation ATPase